MQALIEALEAKFDGDYRLRKTGRQLITDGREPSFFPHVMFDGSVDEYLDTFDSDIKRWTILFTARCKGTNRSKVEAILANLRRVFDHLGEAFAGVNIACMYLVGSEPGTLVEGSKGLWVGTVSYETYVERLAVESEARP